MRIPDEFQTPEFWGKLYSWVYGMLRSGYKFNKKYRYFDLKQYEGDVAELAKEIVQETLMRVCGKREPQPPIRYWRSYFYVQLSIAVQSEQRKLERQTYRTIGLESPMSDSSSCSKELRPIDIHEAPEANLWRMQDQVLKVVDSEMRRLISEGKIRDTRQVQPFIEIISRFLQNWQPGIDGHRQEVEKEYDFTPSKATVDRWWRQVRASMPTNINDYR